MRQINTGDIFWGHDRFLLDTQSAQNPIKVTFGKESHIFTQACNMSYKQQMWITIPPHEAAI
jgi:hypothetical protein